jgi:hypothetical protein
MTGFPLYTAEFPPCECPRRLPALRRTLEDTATLIGRLAGHADTKADTEADTDK